jgi:hypothetical protein
LLKLLEELLVQLALLDPKDHIRFQLRGGLVFSFVTVVVEI